MAAKLVDLYREHGPAVFARCRRLLGADEAAAEVTVETFASGGARERGDLLAAAEEICLRRLPAGRLTLLGDGPDPAAEERFRRAHLEKRLPAIERAERPPFVLRWVWYVGPVLVATAMTCMVFAARSAGGPEKRAAARAGVEAYAERGGHTFRVASGGTLRRGERVHLVVVPAGADYVVVAANGHVVATLGPLADTETRVNLADALPLGAPGLLHVDALLSSRPLAPATVEIALARGGAGDLPAARVSFDAVVE